MNISEPLYIGIGGRVVAIDRATGSELWRCKLKSNGFVTVYSDASGLYAAAAGELYAIDRATGAILWRNKLKGLGMSIIAFAGNSGSSYNVTAAAIEQAAAAAR
jgi:outer membrane protein assembly factor BamB